MVSKDFTIINKASLHMRAAHAFAVEMNRFFADVTIQCGDKDINAKSIMGLMAAGIQCGAQSDRDDD